MKILAIRGKNLASLEGEFEVDFTVEPLRSAGIFAITGQTGSGKSTLLDALCLALFDETPRNNKPSDGANIIDVKNNTISQTDSRNILRRGTSEGYAEVDFVSLGGEKFRCRWSVRRSREKINGKLQGTVITLHNLHTETEQQGTKTELLRQISELIGLNFDQFTRAVLLAQGDFATFLKAGKNEKADLLEKLTGTDIYSRISTSIYEKTKEAEQDFSLLNERIKGLELLSNEDLEAITIEKQTIISEIKTLKVQLTELNDKIKWITDHETLNNSVEQIQKKMEEAQIAIEKAEPRYDYLAQIDSVQEIRDSYTELKNAKKQLAENEANLIKQKEEQDTNIFLLAQASKKVIVCETEQKQHLELVALLEPQIDQAHELDIHIESAKRSSKEAKAEYEQALQSQSKTETIVKTAETAIKEIKLKIEKQAIWFKNNAQYKEIIPRIGLIVSLLDDATSSKKQGNNNAKTLTDSVVILNNDAQKLRELKAEAERLNNLLPTEIALLRAKLIVGSPCPVCGSLHHPMSNIKGEILEEAELNKAKSRVNDLIAKLTDGTEKRKNENIRLQSVIDSYSIQFNEAISKLNTYLINLPEWPHLFEKGMLQQTLRDLAGNWLEYTSEETKMSEQITNLQTTLQLEQKNLAEISQMFTLKEQKFKNSESELNKLMTQRATLLSGRNVHEVKEECFKKNKEITDRLTQLIIQKNTFESKNEKLTGVITQISEDFIKLTEQKNKAHFLIQKWITNRKQPITLNQLTDLLSKDSRWLAVEREELNRLRENKTAVQATLDERLKTIKKHYEANIKPSEGETKELLLNLLSDKNSQFEQKYKRSTELEMKLITHAQRKDKFKTYEKELDEKRALTENWKKLNDMFGSADGAKFRVLAQGYTLDALLIYANKHLQELSKRYELQRIPDTLALQVIDLDMLGEIRTVHSLSGGESFLISLALALGLSSLSSNKMKVESLFIDEGFGSLDVDTLRVAMDALENLQTQGRKIGVISHIAEMTERITVQIRVVKTVNGRSKIEI